MATITAEECLLCKYKIMVKNTDVRDDSGEYLGAITRILHPLFSGEPVKKYVCPFCYGEGVTFEQEKDNGDV